VDLVGQLTDAEHRTEALAAMVPYLSGELRQRVLADVLRLSSTCREQRFRVKILGELIQNCCDQSLDNAFQNELRTIRYDSLATIKCALEILPYLPRSIQSETLWSAVSSIPTYVEWHEMEAKLRVICSAAQLILTPLIKR